MTNMASSYCALGRHAEAQQALARCRRSLPVLVFDGEAALAVSPSHRIAAMCSHMVMQNDVIPWFWNA